MPRLEKPWPSDHTSLGYSRRGNFGGSVFRCVLAERYVIQRGCLGGAVVERWTRDRKAAGSTPGRGAIKSTRSTQPSIPLG